MAPVASPAHIGEPSLIKHAFLIIRENRTYDQILGDVAAGNGDAELAVFGGQDTPNAHAPVQRFPLLDNFYDPRRQIAYAATRMAMPVTLSPTPRTASCSRKRCRPAPAC
jgi:hypothetical protein